ncbi:ABC transporter permease [bacterium]|nr:ABC transporter permease [bacterium]MBU1676260.1 ABC transporter permease [bacterium]
MILEDVMVQAARAVSRHRLRSLLTTLGIVIGVASVILLTSIGEGARQHIVSEFTQFGTNLVSINPGHSETSGMPGLGGTVHELTLADMEALLRLRGVAKAVPVTMGTAPVEYGELMRNTFIYGSTSDGPEVWSMGVRQGRFLPAGDLRRGSPVAVLGPTLKRELFGEANALGEHVRIAGQRFRVIGVMAPQGQFLGFDIDDAAYVPVALSMPLFNRDDLQEIDLLIANTSLIDAVAESMRELLIDRHHGEEDFTITTQTGMLESFGRIIDVVSGSVGGIGAISLLVGAIGILTMMWITVNERTAEIGLAKAIGATPRQILALYLAEAAMLSGAGGILGLLAGFGASRLLHAAVPGLPVHTPPLYVALALAVSVLVGLVSGLLPARRAARLDPVVALGAE